VSRKGGLEKTTQTSGFLKCFFGLQVTTKNAKVWNNIGHAYEGKEQWEEALKYFNQARLVYRKQATALLFAGGRDSRVVQVYVDFKRFRLIVILL